MKKFFLFTLICLLIPVAAYANTPPVVDSPSVILIEQTTGRVLFSRNERERRFPASMTKMVTALIAVEHLELEDVITIGQEIRGMPAGSGANIHFEGETITVEMLLRSMLIPSSNEPARVLALNVMRKLEGRRNISYDQAEHAFAVLMNETALSLGTVGTHFLYPFGVQSENHFSTAYDIAIITRAFMDNPTLAEISGTRVFEGTSLNGVTYDEPNEREYSWANTNLLLPGAAHGYPYMTGTGTAENGELQLITVVIGGTEPERLQDTRRLLDYGFQNFSFIEIAKMNETVETVIIENPCLGQDETLEIILSEGYTALLSRAEFAAISRIISYNPLLYVETESDDFINTLRAPIQNNEEVGKISYIIDNNVIFETPVIAGRTVEERTFDSDMDYYIAAFFTNIFTRQALPYWFGFVGTAFGIFGIYIAISTSRRAGKAIGWAYERHRKSKYSRYK